MLIEFKVSNLRSIGEEQILSLVPAPKQKDYEENILTTDGYESLNAIAIYGANGSGKSNLILAMCILGILIRGSGRFSSTEKLPYDPFLLREGWSDLPTSMEVTFILNGHRYRYGFKYDQDIIQKEWLYRKSVGREVVIFLREGDTIEPSSAFKVNTRIIDAAIEATKPNGLFLSSCDMLNISEAVSIIQWFQHFTVMDGTNSKGFEKPLETLWEDHAFKELIIDYMVRMGTGLADIHFRRNNNQENNYQIIKGENTNNGISSENPISENTEIFSSHYLYDKTGNKTDKTIFWKFEAKESGGTNKALHLCMPVLFTLKYGGILIIDEIEAKMHPMMTLDTINMFLDEKLNRKRAQLIFATHDTNLLTYAKLRRDQIYFAEKNSWESTEFYSLSDFVYISDMPGARSKERPDTDKEKRYFEGRYGAVPTLGKLKHLLESNNG